MAAYLEGVLHSFAPLCLMRDSLGEARFSEVWGAVESALYTEFGEGPVQVPMTALLGVGSV